MISVIMPAYNRSRYIGDAIEGILKQTFADFELLIIDDGSKDDTVDIVKRYAEKDSRVKLIINEKNMGVGATRNVGLHAAQYPWIAMMDSDDVALPTRFERQVAAIKSDPEVVGWATDTLNMGSDGDVLKQAGKPGGPRTKEEYAALRKKGAVIYIATTTSIFRKDLALQVGGFDPRFKSAGDTEFFDRLGDHGPILAIPEELVLYRLHQDGIMGKRYSELYVNTRYLEERCKARLHGKNLTLDEFMKDYQEKGKSPLVRFQRYADMTSQLHYRNAGVYISKKQFIPGLTYLGLAALLNPSLILGRVWRRLMPARS